MRSKKKKMGGSKDFLEPITSKAKRKRFATFDIESKDGDELDQYLPGAKHQRPGFTRPFLVGFFDPWDTKSFDGGYQEFRDEPHLAKRDPKNVGWRTRHIQPGGCIDKLLNVILVKQYSGYVFYSHNGGNFDELFLLTWLQEHREDFGFEVIPIQSTIQVIRVWRVPENPDDEITDKWEFLDSMRLLPFGLQKACESFGVDGKDDVDLNWHEEDPRWSVYLKQDCIALCSVMTKFYDLIETRFNSEVGITTPSTAMKLFRRCYLGKNGVQEKINRYIHFPSCKDQKNGRCTGCAHDWIRQGYYGGRTEIFRMFGRRLHYYDINSSYVAAMGEDMPIGDRLIEDTLDWRKHHSRGGAFSGFCECVVYVPETCPIPPLPHRGEFGKLNFPVGRFRGVWSVEELALLEDPLVGGHVEEVIKTVWFKMKPMFGKMVEDLWTLRDKTLKDYDEGLSTLAKLLGNSAYGKFAMKQERTTVVFTKDDRKDELGRPTRCFLCAESVHEGLAICPECEGSKSAMDEVDGDVWYQAKKVDAPYIIPQIAAHITALARVRLWRYMREAIVTPWSAAWREWRNVKAEVQDAGELAFKKHAFDVVGRNRGFGAEEVRDRIVAENAEEAFEAYRIERTLIVGDAVFLEGPKGPASLVCRLSGETAFVRHLAEHERGMTTNVRLSHLVLRGGRIFYSDTDSCITDVVIPSSKALGALKDEYPGEAIDYLAVQPKVYMISNADAPLRRKLLEDALAGDDSIDMSTLGNGALKLGYKVTMKGFPRNLRTKENLERLMAKQDGTPGDTLHWVQLEKVRTLARTGFRRPPRMAEPSKSFQTKYDKRIEIADGATRARVVDESIQQKDEAAE